MSNLLRGPVALSALVALSAQVHAVEAGSGVDATLSNFGFALDFPDPSKPQDPFIGVVDGTGLSTASGHIEGDPSAPSPTSMSIDDLYPNDLHIDDATALARYSATYGAASNLDMTTSVHASGGTGSFASIVASTDVMVSAWSVATYTTTLDLHSQLQQLCNGTCDHLQVTGSIQLQLADGSGPVTRDSFSYLADAANGPQNGSLVDDAVSKLLKVSFDNSHSGDVPTIRLQYALEAFAYSGALAAPVPEPDAAWLLGAGLSVLGLLARRKAKTA